MRLSAGRLSRSESASTAARTERTDKQRSKSIICNVSPWGVSNGLCVLFKKRLISFWHEKTSCFMLHFFVLAEQ